MRVCVIISTRSVLIGPLECKEWFASFESTLEKFLQSIYGSEELKKPNWAILDTVQSIFLYKKG